MSPEIEYNEMPSPEQIRAALVEVVEAWNGAARHTGTLLEPIALARLEAAIEYGGRLVGVPATVTPMEVS